MSIHIDPKKCIACGACVEVCPGNLLTLENNSARCRDVRDCWGCTACVKACPRQAICYYLAPDLGGAGAKLYALDRKNTLTWRLEFPDGSEQSIVVDKNQSNQY